MHEALSMLLSTGAFREKVALIVFVIRVTQNTENYSMMFSERDNKVICTQLLQMAVYCQ
jgi:hypothetical protein